MFVRAQVKGIPFVRPAVPTRAAEAALFWEFSSGNWSEGAYKTTGSI